MRGIIYSTYRAMRNLYNEANYALDRFFDWATRDSSVNASRTAKEIPLTKSSALKKDTGQSKNSLDDHL